MDQYQQWEELVTSPSKIPLPHEDFEQYFPDYNEVDNLINETLTGLQELDVPSGFVHQNPEKTSTSHHTHSRKISGTAIFGYVDHNRDLSINGLNNEYYKKNLNDIKSISPGELKIINSNSNQQDLLDFNFDNPEIKPILLMEEDEYNDLNTKNHQTPDLKITNDNPQSYKFPPPPASLPIKQKSSKNQPNLIASSPIKKNYHSVNNYSVKYLQELNNLNQDDYKNYADDIEPLLNDDLPRESTPFYDSSFKYVPIPVQEPKIIKRLNPLPPSYLAPPQPPTLSNGSPELQSSPEPLSPSPSRSLHGIYQDSSPVHPQLKNGNFNFHVPQFLSEADEIDNDIFFSNQPQSQPLKFQQDEINIFNQQEPSKQIRGQNHQHQSYNVHHQQLQQQQIQNQQVQEHLLRHPQNNQQQDVPPLNNIVNQLHSSPIHPQSNNNSPNKFYSSPIRNNYLTNDDTVDANATITQLTPLKNNFPITPSRNQVQLEWSPIISPNIKGSKDVKRHIQQSTPKRIKKTSLLPPGELDQYWEGPDESKTYTCIYRDCGKKFTRRYNVRSHIQTHLSDRPFACSYCPKKFVRQHDLNRHIKGHLEARHCKCPCGKEFARLDALKKHRERNICIGGNIGFPNNSITKPRTKSKSRNDHLDEFTSEKLADQLTSSMSDEEFSPVD